MTWGEMSLQHPQPEQSSKNRLTLQGPTSRYGPKGVEEDTILILSKAIGKYHIDSVDNIDHKI